MPDVVAEAIKNINIAQLIAIGLMIWFFYNRLDAKIIKLESKLDGKIDSLEKKFDSRFEKVDTRFDRIENRLQNLENNMIEVKTILRMKECCMIQDDSQLKKAE